MRIDRESLIRVVQRTVSARSRADRSLISIYLGGSLLDDEYMLGGTVDIDLFFVHSIPPEIEREIVRLTDEVHLDIAHHDQADYRQTRRIRLHPWMGPTVNRGVIYYDPGHFMDFTQASVRGQFERADYILARARTQAEKARQIWFSYEMNPPLAGPREAWEYLDALGYAGNAVASLSGPPLTERRFLLNFPQRTEAIGRGGLALGFLGLLGVQKADAEIIRGWLEDWEAAYRAIPDDRRPIRLHHDRLNYYQSALKAILDSERPEAALWPLLRTWTLAVNALPDDHPALTPWLQATSQLELGGEYFAERIAGLDAYLDLVEETLDQWAGSQGV